LQREWICQAVEGVGADDTAEAYHFFRMIFLSHTYAYTRDRAADIGTDPGVL
jgi:hypothetical protein